MAQVINTNSLSLITQNNINKNQSALSSSIERLSSGLRINSAKDDAAGQAIANRFTSNIKGLTQAARNANDGISVAQTTEGALSEINNNLQRIRELTVQASTGTNSDSDLDSIQDEIKSRLDEIDRVSGQTQFNGVNVLAKDGSMKIQVGANDGQTITIDLKKIDSDTLGLSGFNVNGSADKASVAATADGMVKDGYIKGLTSSDGSTAYTKTTANTAAKGSDILAALKTGDKITATGANSLADNATSTTYTYNATSNTFSYTADGVNQTNAAANLIPAAGKTTAASVTIGGTAQNVNIDVEATRKIARSTADVKIIMLTVHTENPLPAKVMQAGAAGYLSKGAAPQEVVSAIRSVYSGQRYIASDIAQQMALSQIEPEKTESPFASLSERELQIMLMITKGQKVNEISEQLNLSPKTVNSYRYRMFSKLNIHGDVELTHLAIRHGLCNAETLSSQ